MIHCHSKFTIMRLVKPGRWRRTRIAYLDISCTKSQGHNGKHGGVVAGEVDAVPTRMDVEW